ncbi:MAG: hypothetical protein ACRDH9_06470 [Actinomycetota bacterium]
MRTKPVDRRESPIPVKRPSPRARALYFLGGLPLALLVIALSRLLGWSLALMLEVGAVAGAVYVLIATPLLLGRRA